MPRSAEWLLIGVGFVIGAGACALLLDSFWGWNAGPWADCPNYAFGRAWYPEPPLIVTFIPCGASVAATALFTALLVRFVRERRRLAALIASAGLVVGSVPLIAAVVLPIISNALGMTTAGC